MENYKAINFHDVIEIAKRIRTVDEYDEEINFVDDVVELEKNRILTESEKCVLGLAYTFWPLAIDKLADDKRNHRFFLHNFWNSACAMESVFKKYGDIDCGFVSPAPFVNSTVDAVFVVINSMSRGFNITFGKSFGGDRRLQRLAAIFTMHVCKHYYKILAINPYKCNGASFEIYKGWVDYICGTGEKVPDIEMRTLHSQFLSWLRTRTHRAFDVFCKLTTEGIVDMARLESAFLKSIPETMKSDHIAVMARNEPIRRARQERIAKVEAARDAHIAKVHECMKRNGDKNEDHHKDDTDKRNVKYRLEETPTDRLPEDMKLFGGFHIDDDCKIASNSPSKEKPEKVEYSQLISVNMNGNEFEIRRVKDSNRYDIYGEHNLTDEDIAFLKELDMLPQGFKLVDSKHGIVEEG